MKNELTNKVTELRAGLAAAGYDPAMEGTLARLLDVLQETNRSIASVATDIGISSTRLSRLLSGKYQADLGPSLGMVREFLRRFEEGRLVEPDHFVETETFNLIKNGIDYAVLYHQVVNIFGESQIGKTFAVEEYQARARAAGSDHVVFIRMASSPSPITMAEELCRELGLEPRRRLRDMRGALLSRISPRHVLIVDEIHQISLGNGLAGLRTVEFLREIHDLTHCGLVLIGTNVWRAVLTTTHSARKDWQGWLVQLQKRGPVINCPHHLSHKDTSALYTAYGLPEPDKDTLDVVRHLVLSQGIGVYAKRLQAAATAARAAGKKFAWQHFLAVHGQLEKLASGIK